MAKTEKPTSAPLPRRKHESQRAEALRGNLQKRKEQARARKQQEKE
jgi:hypothetical protein